MTADKALSEVKAYIESRQSGWTVALRDNDDAKTFPRVVLDDVAAQEHDTLRGVMNPLTVEVNLISVPHAQGSSASATTMAEHQSMSATLYDIIGDNSMVTWIDDRSELHLWRAEGAEGITEESDNRRSTRFELRLTCAIK